MITRPFGDPIQRRIALTLLTLAGAFAIAASWQWTVERRFLRDSRVAAGTVIAPGKDNQATFRFVDDAGTEQTVRSSRTSMNPTFRVKQRVAVLYLPGDGASAKVNEPMEIWLLTRMLAYGAIVCGVLGGLILRGRLNIGPLKQTRVWVRT